MARQGKDPVVGARIVRIRAMTVAEAKREGWEIDHVDGPPSVVELDSGAILYPSRDPEGNGPGALFGYAEGKMIVFR